MISRLTAIATVFSIFAAASLTYAASAQQHAVAAAPAVAAKQVRIVQLQHVTVVAKRLPQQAI